MSGDFKPSPQPSPKGRGGALLEIIRDKIRKDGPMSLADYMGLCLSHPEHGYYMTRDPLGAGGDFTTAPEVSQMFGEMVGAWLADIWIQMGLPPDFTLLECGPGRGTLMADIMRATKRVPGFHDAARIHLMEIGPVLRAAQTQALSSYDPVWVMDLEGLPKDIPLLVVANEFLDALPVQQISRTSEGFFERVVVIDDNNSLRFAWKEADFALCADHMEEGVFEVSPILNQFMKSLSFFLKKQGGIALFVDYGHVRTACGETVQAMRNHRFENILTSPGECDLTAHVDFENVGRIAASEGLLVHGPVTQGAFLKALGIEARAAILADSAGVTQHDSLMTDLHRLIDTSQMGTLFKVMALCDDPCITPAGFHEGL